jgi:hypothetical protein
MHHAQARRINRQNISQSSEDLPLGFFTSLLWRLFGVFSFPFVVSHRFPRFVLLLYISYKFSLFPESLKLRTSSLGFGIHETALAHYTPGALFARFCYCHRFSQGAISYKGVIKIYGAVADLYTATERWISWDLGFTRYKRFIFERAVFTASSSLIHREFHAC